MKNDPNNRLEPNPLATVIGGIVIGAISAALLPKSRHEDKYLGALGRNMRGRARNATAAAKEAGKEHLDSIGLNRDSATTQMRDLATKLGKAASAAGTAAAQAARKK